MSSPRGPILVVDDFMDNREMYAEYLAFVGYEVLEAADGDEALRMARELTPALIVMDLTMPRVDGWKATRLLKQDPRTRDIPVLVVTGHALKGAEEGARAVGADAFLAKPCLPEALLAEVKRLLGDP